MPPEAYYIHLRVMLLLMQRDIVVGAFSLIPIVSDAGIELAKNAASQLLGYEFGVFTNRPIDPVKFIPPLISYGKPAFDFIQQATGVTRVERVSTLAFIFSGAGFLTKTGDPVVNAGMGGFIYLLCQYVEDITNAGGGGNVPFLIPKANRISKKKYSTKQHIQYQLVLTGSIIIFTGISWCIIYIFKKVFKSGPRRMLKTAHNQFKKIRRKNLTNIFSKIKSRIKKIKILRSTPKVQFIPLD